MEGKSVIISGLKSRKDLNGKYAFVDSLLENGRLKVRLIESDTFLSIDPLNVTIIPDESDYEDYDVDEDYEDNEDFTYYDYNTIFPPNQTVLPKKTFFYPTGNTPARFLLEQFPVHLKSADILLLGCGDLRHVLYTCWQLSQSHVKQKMNVVICDLEPSIIARNIVLLKMIADDINLNEIFCIFYSQYLDQTCMSTLQNCCKSLLRIGDDLSHWHSTSFGNKIRFCDTNTYSKAREIWTLYSQGGLSLDKVKIRERYKRDYCKERGVSNITIATAVFQCSSPCTFTAAAYDQEHDTFFKEYHQIGHLPFPIYSPPNQPSTSPPSTLNPMILRGNQQLHDLHYGLDPSLGFHLSLLHAEIEPTHPLHSKFNNKKKLTSEHIYQCCFKQFTAWCLSYHSQFLSQLISFQCFTGEAFVLSQILQNTKKRNQSIENDKRISNQYFPKYSDTTAITLLDDVPLEYDVIDTSNLGDYFGLLQVLLYCIDLMKQSPHSVLYTEAISTVKLEEDGGLDQQLKTDIFTLSSLLGILLQESYTYCSDNSINNIGVVVNKLTNKKDCTRHSIYTWKLAGRALNENSSPENKIIQNKLLLAQDHFTSIFINIYINCFRASYGSRDMFEAMSEVSRFVKQSMGLGQNLFARPITLTYVTLLQKAARNIEFMEGSLSDAVYAITRAVPRTNLMCASNHLQDLLVWCTRLGVITTDPLLTTIDEIRDQYRITDSSPGMRHFGSSPALFVYLTLLVPKTVLDELLSFLQTAMVELAILTPAFDNRFTSLHFSHIRRVIPQRVGAAGVTEEAVMEGDVQLQHLSLCLGSPAEYSYLAVTAVIPSYMISLFPPHQTRVALILSTETYVKLPEGKKQQYGAPPAAYVAPLSDTSHVSWRDAPPLEPSATSGCDTPSTFQPTMAKDPVTVDISGFYPALSTDGKILQYMNEVVIPRAAISAASPPVVVPGNHPCEAVLFVNSTAPGVRFAVPPLCDIARGRLDRFGGSTCFTLTLLPLQRAPPLQFPLCRMKGGPYPWGLSRVLLDSLPKLQVPNTQNYETHWLYVLAGMQFSSPEKEFRGTPMQSAVSCLKDSIHIMMLKNVGFLAGGSRCRWFALFVGKQLKALLFINAMRLELSSATVVLDCVMACVTDANESPLLRMLPVISQQQQEEISEVNVTPEEYCLWRQMAPAMNERCRCSWSHGPGCEYGASSRDTLASVTSPPTPTTPSSRTIIMCSCGLGQDLQNTEFSQKYSSSLASCFQYFHRIAITPMLSLIESGTTSQKICATSSFVAPNFPCPADHKQAWSAGTASPSSILTSAVAASALSSSTASSSASTLTSASTTDSKHCANCRIRAVDMKVCSRCQSIHYCSQQCQQTDWSRHKKHCKANRAMKK